MIGNIAYATIEILKGRQTNVSQRHVETTVVRPGTWPASIIRNRPVFETAQYRRHARDEARMAGGVDARFGGVEDCFTALESRAG